MATEDLSKWKHVVKIAFLLSALMALIYTMGWHMGQDECRKKIIAAIKAGDHQEAAKLLHERQENGSKPDAFMWQTAAAISFKTGNINLAEACVLKSIETGD